VTMVCLPPVVELGPKSIWTKSKLGPHTGFQLKRGEPLQPADPAATGGPHPSLPYLLKPKPKKSFEKTRENLWFFCETKDKYLIAHCEEKGYYLHGHYFKP